MGRPSLLTEDIITRIVAAVSIGAKPEQAARALGIGRRTWYDWVKRAQEPKGPSDQLYVTLLDEIDRARGSAYVELMMQFRELARRDWRAAMKLLEMTDRDWARAGGQEVASAPGDPPKITIIIETAKQPRYVYDSDLPKPDRSPGERGRVVDVPPVVRDRTRVEPPSPDESVAPGGPVDLEAAARTLDAPQPK